jgi:hypothetical protein
LKDVLARYAPPWTRILPYYIIKSAEKETPPPIFSHKKSLLVGRKQQNRVCPCRGCKEFESNSTNKKRTAKRPPFFGGPGGDDSPPAKAGSNTRENNKIGNVSAAVAKSSNLTPPTRKGRTRRPFSMELVEMIHHPPRRVATRVKTTK